MSLSEKESRALASQAAQKEDTSDLSKQMAALLSLPPDQIMTTLATLPKKDQDWYLARVSNSLDTAASKGDHAAQTIAAVYREQINHLYPKATSYELFLQHSAEAVDRLGLNKRDSEQERHESQALAIELLDLWKSTRRVLQSYEGLIQSRWLKETRSCRREILLRAWPDMPEQHRPDMAHCFRGARDPGPQDVGSFMWPYINLEDLLKPKSLLIFLNSRGRHHPSTFAYSDLELAPMYKIRKEFIAILKTKFTMNLLGSTDISTYGEWIEWADESSASESIRAGRTVHVEHGSQILNIQIRIMKFLVFCVAQILHDVDWTAVPPVLPEPPRLSDQDQPFNKMEIIAREAPYRLPTQLDLARLQTLVAAQKSQATDHAWSLREDPGYFASTAEEYCEHRNELILDKTGNTHPHASDFPLYNKAVRHMAADAHCLVFVWDEILQRISQIQKLWERYSVAISIERDLPAELHENLAELRFFLESVMLSQVADISVEIQASPYHYRANPNDPNPRLFDVRVLPLDENNASLRHLLQLKGTLCDSGARDCFTLHALMDEFERLMQTDSRAKALVSAHLAKSLSRLSIFAECLHQLHQFQPWAHKIESDIEEHKVKFVAEYHKVFKHWGLVSQHYTKFEDKTLFKLCSPRNGKFVYPVQEHPTRVNIDKMRSAEAALDAFWKGANEHWLRLIRTTPGALVKHIMGERTLVRTPPWVTPSQGSKVPKSMAPASATLGAFSKDSHDVMKQVTGNFSKTEVVTKSKNKTRGVAEIQDGDQSTTDPIPALQSASKATFKVNKRALKVFRTLFHSPNSPSQPGEVAWPDLLHAMISVGFGAEKLRSSAWQFTPPASMAERPIQLHEPHPGNKLPFVLARHYGRRLNIAFQWTSGSFELA